MPRSLVGRRIERHRLNFVLINFVLISHRDGGPVCVMKRLLLSLCLVGAVFPGHHRPVLQTAQDPPTPAEQRVTFSLADPVMPDARPSPLGVRIAVSSLIMRQDRQSITTSRENIERAPLPPTGKSFEPSVPALPEAEKHEAIWAVVIRGATVHSGPSVSAPTIRFYAVGTELQLINYQDGWFQVLDPTTSERGWIYEKYYLEAIRGPGQMLAALQKTTRPKQKIVNAGKSAPHVRRANKTRPRPAKKSESLIASAPRYRHETMASILDRALGQW